MDLKPFEGFRSLKTHHCVTGSMLHIYHFHCHPLSEDMLFGLGSGLGFIYWHMKGTAPMFGGRGNVGRPGEDGLEITAGRRTGVRTEKHTTGSLRKAEATLLEMLEAGEPVMMNVDMGFLPYFEELPDGFHFGGHAIVIGGYDPDKRMVLVADRDEPLHPVPLDDLGKARGSKFKPFPPENMAFTFDFSQARMPTAAEIQKAIGEVCAAMLEGPISNLGVRGIRKAAKKTLKWPEVADEEVLRWWCFNTFIFIDAAGGTGGGLFRYMYARFLDEAAEILGEDELSEIGEDLRSIGDKWQMVAEIFRSASESENPAARLPDTTEPMVDIADREELVWRRLSELVKS
ncbi:MAG TPA: BtrH N-terminal domain-containing protein [Anaerolineales bacterium]|nr:BtrH N-terminal domain-containing protein [Anaerolineales bacterium]